MAEKPIDIIHDILIKIQDSIVALRDDLNAFRRDVDVRLEHIETTQRKQRRDSAGMLVMMRATAGDFDERVNDVEERVATLEAKRA